VHECIPHNVTKPQDVPGTEDRELLRQEQRRAPPLRTNLTRNVKTYSLNDDPTRELWDDLMKDTIKQVAVWGEYKDHVKR
jgi:hypothetical protein